MIDERSQVSSKVLAAAEQNILECILVSRIEKSSEEVRLPAILLFGDNHRLLPIIDDRAIQGYSKYNNIVQATDLADRSYNLQKPTRRTSIETHQQSPVQGM